MKYIDSIPQLPDIYIQEILNNERVNRSPHTDEKYKFYRCSDELKQWINDNIRYKITKIGIQEMFGTILPHRDPKRDYALNYIIKTGCGELCYYNTNVLVKAGNYVPYNLVKEVGRYAIEPFRWHIINTKKLHGVVGVTEPRLSLTVDIEL